MSAPPPPPDGLPDNSGHILGVAERDYQHTSNHMSGSILDGRPSPLSYQPTHADVTRLSRGRSVDGVRESGNDVDDGGDDCKWSVCFSYVEENTLTTCQNITYHYIMW